MASVNSRYDTVLTMAAYRPIQPLVSFSPMGPTDYSKCRKRLVRAYQSCVPAFDYEYCYFSRVWVLGYCKDPEAQRISGRYSHVS